MQSPPLIFECKCLKMALCLPCLVVYKRRHTCLLSLRCTHAAESLYIFNLHVALALVNYPALHAASLMHSKVIPKCLVFMARLPHSNPTCAQRQNTKEEKKKKTTEMRGPKRQSFNAPSEGASGARQRMGHRTSTFDVGMLDAGPGITARSPGAGDAQVSLL